MSNDPSHGTPSPSTNDDSPNKSDESRAAEDESAADNDPAASSNNEADSDPQFADLTGKKSASNPDSDSDGQVASSGGSEAGVPRSGESNEGEASGDSANSESPSDDSTSKGADDGESSDKGDDADDVDDHDKDHEWHDEHDDYSPEYDDPYHDEHDEGKGREGEDAHYHEEDDYHHQHDGDHGSGHSIGGGASSSGKKTESSSKKSTTSSDDDWDDDDDGGGGPVKNFLEHLEDLRWVIIKCVVAVLVCMCLCLVGANKAVEILQEPLVQANKKIVKQLTEKAREDRIKAHAEGLLPLTLQFHIGTKYMDFKTSKETFLSFGGDPESTNNIVPLRLVPMAIGTNIVMGFEPIDSDEVIETGPKIDLPKLVPKGPLTPFMLALKTAFFGGFGLASPFVFFFIGQFVLPALHTKEKKYLGYGVFVGTGLFLLGASFAYLVITKLMLGASVLFADWLGFQSTIWIIDEYIAVVLKLLLGVGLGFELPVVLLTLVKVGILDYQKLNALRAYAVIVILVLCAVLTPPDVISQVLMAMPLYLLYEISVIIAYIWFRQEQREEGAGTDD